MNVLKTGFLFVASEFGNHYLYQITHLGDNEPEFSSAKPLEVTEIRAGDKFDSYIIVSFVNATLVLSIGQFVEEVGIICCILCILGGKSFKC